MVVFVRTVPRCMALNQLLVEQNFPSIAIHRNMPQEERLSRYQQFKDFQKRILVATNLFGRGMDIERVNIVFNYDMPEVSILLLGFSMFQSCHLRTRTLIFTEWRERVDSERRVWL